MVDAEEHETAVGPWEKSPAGLEAELQKELQKSQRTETCSCLPGAQLAQLAVKVLAAGGEGSGPCDKGPQTCEGSIPQKIILRKDASTRLGLVCCDMALLGRRCLVVVAVEGIAELWNDTCSEAHEPWRRLHVGCTILAVNGVSGNTKRMQIELETAREVELLLCNPPSISSFRSVMNACDGQLAEVASWAFWPTTPQAQELGPSRPSITVIITTSPVPSNPSTDLLERVLQSLYLIPLTAPKIIVCDGYKLAGGRSNPKAGKISALEAERYEEYIKQLQRCCTRDMESESSAYFRTRLLVLPDRHGFGFAVKSALEEVDTEYVLVVQHDQEFIAPFDLPMVLCTMTQHREVKYVGLSSVSTLKYDDMVRSKFGISISRNTEFGIPLLPLIFFYDKPHICRADYYREILGAGSLVRKGDFIEETLGIAQRDDILKNGMEAHEKYGTFQLDDRDEQGRQYAVVRHVNGRAFLSPQQRLLGGWGASLRFTA